MYAENKGDDLKEPGKEICGVLSIQCLIDLSSSPGIEDADVSEELFVTRILCKDLDFSQLNSEKKRYRLEM